MIRKKSVALPLVLLLSVGYAKASTKGESAVQGKPAALDTTAPVLKNGESDSPVDISAPSPTGSPKSRRISLTDTMPPLPVAVSCTSEPVTSLVSSSLTAANSASAPAQGVQNLHVHFYDSSPSHVDQPRRALVSPTTTVELTPKNITLAFATKPKDAAETIASLSAGLRFRSFSPTTRRFVDGQITEAQRNLTDITKIQEPTEQKAQSVAPDQTQASSSSSSSTSTSATKAEAPGFWSKNWNNFTGFVSATKNSAHRRLSSMAGAPQSNTQSTKSTK